MTPPIRRPGIRIVSSLVLFFFVLSGFPIQSLVSRAWAGEEEDLAQAKRHFEIYADYEAALAIVDRLVGGEASTKGTLRDAYVLRARCLLAMNREAEAPAAFCNAVRCDHSWQPDEFECTQEEIDVFNRAMASCPEARRETLGPGAAPGKEKKGPPWKLLAAGGVVLVAGLVLLLTGGGDEDPIEDEDLPGFPDKPTD